jgi:hypothetical protein
LPKFDWKLNKHAVTGNFRDEGTRLWRYLVAADGEELCL